MARKSFIVEAVEENEKDGYTLFKYGSGKISFKNNSKLNQAYNACKETHPNAEVFYLTGAKKRYASEGRDWAVIYKENED